MLDIRKTKYALHSLGFSLSMGMVTLIHHLHSSLTIYPDGAGMHVVWNEIILIPLTAALMFWILRNRSKLAIWLYSLIAFAGFVGLGLYEGLWNHTIGLIAYLRIDSPGTQISLLLPRDNLHYWFYETTGVLTFLITMLASFYTFKFISNIYSSE